ncbi:SpoIIE family protein phosphatase [Maridesulfovibrio hydrothermalis]|uniref:Protein serine/threonine phosphatase n=1 Tax=Maridesulfovibrio hydrothermalis AM13 = DSM 14728 TaxID=1121451 RepID=L0R7A6_9BACT|nr:SpoIIE family protein phosphatase [Maridesulfovibrio hydrothermalis]CCO22608.1 Protein serine/threonine phosphatase [Maridesulfovibrio hydrothermalis AM13 = DSM 14728]
MKIRWKILIVLLTFSLVPLFVLKMHGLKSLTHLGSDLQTQTRVTLLERATASLSHMAKATAAIINLQDRLYRTTLKSVQAEAEFRLRDDDTEPLPPVVFITSPSETISKPVLISDSRYKKRALMGRGTARKSQHRMASIQRGDLIDLPIAPDNISFWLTNDLPLKEAMPDITRLEPLIHIFQACSLTLENLALWQDVSLENGLVATYPGHNAFPKKYDPRTHEWYKQVKKNLKVTWTLPALDAATRSLCYRLSAPLFNDKDEFIGVVSLVIPVGTTINSSLLINPESGTTIMMVSSSHPETEQEKKLLIVGQIGDDHDKDISPQMISHFWLVPPEPEWLKEDHPEFNTLVEDVADKNFGVLQMDYKGIPSLWTYTPINMRLSLLIITPVNEFTAEADEAEQYIRESVAYQYEGSSLIALAVIISVALVAYFVSQSLSLPIRKISEAVIKVGEGDWNARADFHSSDELGELAENFNIMVPQLREHSSIQQALSLADEAQQSLFPQEVPSLVGTDIGARCVFSEKTGGDYYDFIGCKACGPDVFAAAIGDVSGHGISAALLMTSARAYIRALTGQGKPLVEVISKVNRLVTNDCAKTGHFMTLTTIICDAGNKTVNWIRAGHDPALIYTPETDSFEELIGEGLALGVDEDYLYRDYLTQMESGQILTLYTDGIWEAHGPAGKQFGKDSLRRIIRDNCHRPSQEIVDQLLEEVTAHRKGLPLEDDCTVIIVKFL